MLSIKDLQVSVEEKAILRGLSLEVRPGKFTPLWGLMAQGKARCQRHWPGVMIMPSPVERWNLTVKTYWSCRRKTGPVKASLWRFSTRWKSPGSVISFSCKLRSMRYVATVVKRRWIDSTSVI